MYMEKNKKRNRTSKREFTSPFNNYWSKENYFILFAGITVVIIGFLLMTVGPWDNPVSLTLSPLVLLVAYIIIFPLAIFFKKKKN